MTLRELLAAAGFKGAALDTAVGVARAESGGNAAAHNTNAGTGDNSYGLFQINMLGAMGPARRATYGLASNDDLLDPATNAKVAYKMSNGGANWSPWSTFKNGAYRALTGGDATITNAGKATSSTTASPAGLLGIPSVDDIGGLIVRTMIIGTGVIAGAGLVLLGLNKATGYPGVKAARAAAGVAL